MELDHWGIPLRWSEPLTESEARGLYLLLEAVDPNDAIVHYPVTINGETHTQENVPYHITMRWGKWNAPKEELVAKVQSALEGLDLSRPRIESLRPEILRGKDGDKEFRVLIIPVTPQLQAVHDALESVFGPDSFPVYKPHITVDDDLWEAIKKQKLLPGDLGVEVQPLEVAMGNAPLETLGESEEEDEEDPDYSNIKSVKELEPLRAELAAAAQKVYDSWGPDEHGNVWCGSQEGPGGICHLIVDEILDVLNKHGFDCMPYSHDTMVHVSTFVKTREGLAEVDIDPYRYETGGGYNWEKIPDVTFDPEDVSISIINKDPASFDEFNEFGESKDFFDSCEIDESVIQLDLPSGLQTKVLKSPTPTQAMNLFKNTKSEAVRYFIAPDYTLYIWDAFDLGHADFMEQMGIEYTSDNYAGAGAFHSALEAYDFAAKFQKKSRRKAPLELQPESSDKKYDASVKGAFDMLTKQKAWIPEAKDDWKSLGIKFREADRKGSLNWDYGVEAVLPSGEVIGSAKFKVNQTGSKFIPIHTRVSDEYQNMGIGTEMYRWMEQTHETPITNKASHQTPAAQEFWARRNKPFGKRTVKKEEAILPEVRENLRGITTTKLKQIQKDHYHNPDTGLELDAAAVDAEILRRAEYRQGKLISKFKRKPAVSVAEPFLPETRK